MGTKMEITTTIIGAGVAGLAVAAELSRTRKGILILERNPGFGQETSSRNSEVIHAGIYYAKDSKKARLCVEGNRLLYRLCEERRIPHRRCGKLIVATEKDEEAMLGTIQEQARENGVDSIEMLSARQINALEPNVKARAGLFSPSTGIIDSHRLMSRFAAQAYKNGVQLVPQTTVTRVERQDDDGYRVHVVYPDGLTDTFPSRWVVNCAGLESDRIAESMGIDIDACGYRLHYWKGEYFSVDVPRGFISRLGLDPDSPQPASQFSRGMQARLAAARALVTEPELLLLDEAASGLDRDGRRTLLALVKEVAPERVVAVATHDLTTAAELADQFLQLRRGRVIHEENLGELKPDARRDRIRDLLDGK
jgi:glycine/D-amino acid oxidase-like deaminating enzyme